MFICFTIPAKQIILFQSYIRMIGIKILVNFLILIFLILIIHKIILACGFVEGLENETKYAEYDTNNPNNALILAQQNAGNISYLKQRLDGMMNLPKDVFDLKANQAVLADQMQKLVQQQGNLTQQVVGKEPFQKPF